jgi:hypothetical protein
LSDDQIDAVSLVGMGADEVHELMLRGIGPRVRFRRQAIGVLPGNQS